MTALRQSAIMELEKISDNIQINNNRLRVKFDGRGCNDFCLLY